MDPAWLLSTLLWMLSVKMSFSTELDILLNVKALNRRGVLNHKPRSDLVAFPHGLVDVRETAQFFSQAQTSIVAISESNWGEIFLKQESPTSCGVVTARNHAQMLSDIWRKREPTCPVMIFKRCLFRKVVFCRKKLVFVMDYKETPTIH